MSTGGGTGAKPRAFSQLRVKAGMMRPPMT
jgi:hypothetical protein